MKKFTKVLSVILAALLLMSLSMLGFSASAASIGDLAELSEFTDLYPVDNSETYWYNIFGDTDMDEVLTVRDATLIQKHLAGLAEIDEETLFLADTDGDIDVTIKDATAIQKALAGLINGVPMQPVYNLHMSEGEVDVHLNFFAATALVKFTAHVDGFYSVAVSDDAFVESSFVVLIDSEYNVINYGNASGVYLEAGDYTFVLENWDDFENTVTVSISCDSEFTLFIPDDATSIDGSVAAELEAGTGPWLYKISGTDDTDTVILYTEGTDPKLSVQVFDSKMCSVSVDDPYYPDQSNLYTLLSLPVSGSDYYYIYITQEADGTDFTLYCGALTAMLVDFAEELELDTTVTVPTEYAEAEEEDFTYAYSAVSGIYKFTPDADGYYKFRLQSEVMGMVEYMLLDGSALEAGIYDLICYIPFDVYGPLDGYDSEYLLGDRDYYIVLTGALIGENDMTITATASNEEEYNSVHEGNDSPDILPTEYENISVGDTVDVELADWDDEKWFKLTAEENAIIIVSSEQSTDARLDVYDARGNMIGTADDMGDPYYSLDFASIGDITEGEEYYFCISTYMEDGDCFTVSVVNADEYVPVEPID